MPVRKNGSNRPDRISIKPRLLALAIAQGIAAGAHAAPITVNSTVDTIADDGACTLREAVISANTDTGSGLMAGECAAGSGADTIYFDSSLSGQTITLSAAGASGQIDITSSLTLQGPGADRLTVSGNNNSRIFSIDAIGVVTVDGLTLTDGRESFGGAIANSGRLSLVDSVISSSNADASAGGAVNHTGSTLTLIGSTLSNNTALVRGGGIYASGVSTAATNLYRSTLSGNRAGIGGYGGGVYSKGGTLRTVNATFSENTAGLGGGIRVESGTLRLTATIVANSGGGDCSNAGSLPTYTANLIEDGTCSAAISGDPMLGPLADNGGSTPTHALTPGSPAIDPDPFAFCGGPDQRGATRPTDGDGDGDARCDTGAFEFLPPLVVDTTALIADDGDCALPEAIENANDDAQTHADCPPGFEADTITFDPVILPGTITLTGSEMTIASALTIQGPGADELTISGGGFSRIFRISDGFGQRQAVNLSGMTLTGGNASSGGAITNSEDLTVEASTLTGNTADNKGGAIDNRLNGILSLRQSTLSGNSADSGGGLSNDGDVTVTGSTLSGNTANRGGGLFNGYAGADATLTDSTLSGNTASIEGGGLFNSELTSSVALINSTLSGNSAAAGGGLFNEGEVAQPGTISLTNTIIADSPGGGDCDNQGAIATNLANLIEDGSCDPDFSGDPLLGPLRDNAGPTPTHLPQPGSPAIDAGDDGPCTAVDQRGNARPADGDDDGTEGCDIGAVEVPQPLRVTEPSFDIDSDFLCTLPEAVMNANGDSQLFTDAGECPAGFGPDRITFDPTILPATITLNGSELLLASALTIQGPGADQLTISGGGASRIFRIDDGSVARKAVGLAGLTLTDGSSFFGGAIYNAEALSIDGSVISGNSAISGGGIANGSYYYSGRTTITNSTISGNTASSGGGIYNYLGDVALTNSTISANTASRGGGLYGAESASHRLVNATIQGNTASISGGGVSNYSTMLHLSNVVIAGSINGDCFNDQGPLTTNVNNLIEDDSCSPALSGDPTLGPLADNGGTTPTHAPLSLSPLIDAGDDGACPGADQTGMPRPIDGDGDNVDGCDIGAFEFVDIFGPSASIASAPDVTVAGGTSYVLVIDYLDDAPIDLGQLDAGDVTVTGPGGPLAISGVTPAGGGTMVTYTLTPPGGAWDEADNGAYAIDLNAGEVFDTATTGANAAAAATLGSFEVTIGVIDDEIFADGFEDPAPPPP